MSRLRKLLLALLPFWIFVFTFKFGGGLHYTLLPTLGAQIFPVWIVGLLIGASSGIQMLLDVPAGYLLDRFGYVRLLIIGTGIFLIGSLSFLFGLNQWTFIINILCSAGGWLFYGPGVDAYVLTAAPKALAGRIIATRDVVMSGGIISGMGLLSFVVYLSAPSLGIIIASILGIGILALFCTPAARGSVHDVQKIERHSFYIRRNFITHVLRSLKKLNPASGLLLLSNFSGSTFYGIVWFVVPLLIQQGIQSHTLGIGLAIFDLSVLIFGYFIGKLTDRWSGRALIFWGLLLFSVMALILGYDFGWLFIIFGFLATTGDEMSSISLWAWLDHLDTTHTDDGLVTGSLSLAQDLGWTIGPIAAGLLFQFFGPSWTIACGSVFLFITWIIAALWTHHIPRDPFVRRVSFHAPRKQRHKR